jgi:hypothetical protein
LRRNLPSLDDVAILIAQRDRDLTRMLVDSKVQRVRGSPVALSQQDHSFIDINAD